MTTSPTVEQKAADVVERLRSEVDHPNVGLRGGFCLVDRADVRTIIAALSPPAAALAPRGEGWQDIATHDGSDAPVLLWFPMFPGAEAAIGYWSPWAEPYGGMTGGDWKDRDLGEIFQNGGNEQVWPTHWQPLPQSPTPADTDEGAKT